MTDSSVLVVSALELKNIRARDTLRRTADGRVFLVCGVAQKTLHLKSADGTEVKFHFMGQFERATEEECVAYREARLASIGQARKAKYKRASKAGAAAAR